MPRKSRQEQLKERLRAVIRERTSRQGHGDAAGLAQIYWQKSLLEFAEMTEERGRSFAQAMVDQSSDAGRVHKGQDWLHKGRVNKGLDEELAGGLWDVLKPAGTSDETSRGVLEYVFDRAPPRQLKREPSEAFAVTKELASALEQLAVALFGPTAPDAVNEALFDQIIDALCGCKRIGVVQPGWDADKKLKSNAYRLALMVFLEANTRCTPEVSLHTVCPLLPPDATAAHDAAVVLTTLRREEKFKVVCDVVLAFFRNVLAAAHARRDAKRRKVSATGVLVRSCGAWNDEVSHDEVLRDFTSEAKKFGTVVYAGISRHSVVPFEDYDVVLQFQSSSSAEDMSAMHGRFYAGRKLVVALMSELELSQAKAVQAVLA